MKRYLIICIMLLAAVTLQAHYVLYNFSGNVTFIQNGKNITPEKGMKVNANDKVTISGDGHVEILNSMTKEIFTSGESGTHTVMSIMLDATKQASSTGSAINDRMRFGSKNAASDTRLYTEGLVRRSMLRYDPGAKNLVVEPKALALHVVRALKSSTDVSEKFPVSLSSGKTVENGREFKVSNCLSFPIYINVIKIRETGSGSVEISELGQPMGSYVVLPGQDLGRAHHQILDPSENHILIMTHCRFDIDELLEHINSLLGDGCQEQPDPNLTVYLSRL